MTSNSSGLPGPDDVDVEAELDSGLDLRPRATASPAPGRRRRRWGAAAVLVLVVAAGAVLITQFLGNSLDYYCNVDEVGVKADCSGDRSLRVQGTVERGSLERLDTQTKFLIGFNGKELAVLYDGDPGGKFQECIPVVVRGRLDGNTLLGSQVEVKHSNEYAAKNESRLDQAESAECPEAA
mgnify:CR=1 FL=1